VFVLSLFLAVEIAKLLEDNRFGNHAHAEQITSLPDECLSFVIGHLSSYNSRALLAIRAALCKTNRLHVSGVSLRDIYDCFFRQVSGTSKLFVITYRSALNKLRNMLSCIM